MAQGMEVLQAALAGKYVGINTSVPGVVSDYLRWCPECKTFERKGKGHSPKVDVTIHQLWHEEWTIEEPTMTFTEAVAAMDAGQTVECPEIGMQFRRDADDYVSRPIGGGDWTTGAVFYFGDIHARDWRIVRREPSEGNQRTISVTPQLVEHVAVVCFNFWSREERAWAQLTQAEREPWIVRARLLFDHIR